MIKENFEKAVNMRLAFVKNGTFFITPNEDCKYCSYKDICRKSHTPTLMRAKYYPQARELEKLTQDTLSAASKKKKSTEEKPKKRKTDANK